MRRFRCCFDLCGSYGIGYLVYKFSYLEYIARYGGAAFLLFYTIKSFYVVAYTMNHALILKELSTPSLVKTALFAFAFTWLNLHVYLDTVILTWSVFTKFGADVLCIWLGAMSASFVFFWMCFKASCSYISKSRSVENFRNHSRYYHTISSRLNLIFA